MFPVFFFFYPDKACYFSSCLEGGRNHQVSASLAGLGKNRRDSTSQSGLGKNRRGASLAGLGKNRRDYSRSSEDQDDASPRKKLRICSEDDCSFCSVAPCGECNPCRKPKNKQKCIARLVSSLSWYGVFICRPGLWIRIHFLLICIRIQLFFSMRIRIQQLNKCGSGSSPTKFVTIYFMN